MTARAFSVTFSPQCISASLRTCLYSHVFSVSLFSVYAKKGLYIYICINIITYIIVKYYEYSYIYIYTYMWRALSSTFVAKSRQPWQTRALKAAVNTAKNCPTVALQRGKVEHYYVVVGAVVLLVWCGCQNSKERAKNIKPWLAIVGSTWSSPSMKDHSSALPSFLPSFLPSCCLPACLPAFLPCCLPSGLPAFLPFFLPAWLPSCLPSSLPSLAACLPAFQPSSLPSFIPACLPACLPAFLPSFLPSL